PARSTRFPYTTLFRSREGAWCMALLLMLRANGQLHQWLEETSHEDIQNPVKEATIRKRIAHRTLLQDPTWRHVCIPSLNGPTRRSEEHTSELQSRENL